MSYPVCSTPCPPLCEEVNAARFMHANRIPSVKQIPTFTHLLRQLSPNITESEVAQQFAIVTIYMHQKSAQVYMPLQ